MRILLVNPPVYDFACFDSFLKPLGLLYISQILKSKGFKVYLLDYMDRFFKYENVNAKDKEFGQGRFVYKVVEKPDVLKKYPRRWKRYGVSQEGATKFLKDIEKPDLIFLTSTMTYWYKGIVEARGLLRDFFPQTPIILGGNYATLMKDHALKNVRPDFIYEGSSLKNLKKF